MVKGICGETSRVDCKDVNEDESYVCQTPCNKKLKCGRHNCTEHECQCVSESLFSNMPSIVNSHHCNTTALFS